MKVVETLVVRDEADIVGAQIAYHLNAGVDFVIATDHESRDGTTEILEAYAREGYLLRIPETGPVREDVWRTRMARLAATTHGADWEISADADEFWWPRRGSIRELLGAVPEAYGVLGCLNRHFLPRPDDGSPFFERMTTRVSLPAALNDPTSPWRPGTKVVHRADPQVIVYHGGYAVSARGLRPIAGWYPFDLLHFPYRSVDQWLRKTARRAHGDKPLAIYVKGDKAREQNRIEDVYSTVDVSRETVERGRALGSLVTDTRLRDVLRTLWDGGSDSVVAFRRSGPTPTHPRGELPRDVDGHEVCDYASLHDATLVRLQRRVDDVALRVVALEPGRRRFVRG